MTPRTEIPVGILGASGYIGAEMMRYVVCHPSLGLRWATANRDAGRRVGQVLPNLGPFLDQSFIRPAEAETRMDEVRVVFLALPHGESQDVLPRLEAAHPDIVWIDLAGDFRTPDPEGFRRYYGHEHRAPGLLDRFVYGFTEAGREALRGARLIANPGCFATGMLLALYPLAKAGLLTGPVALTGITGSSGSGREPSRTTHHPERAANIRAYKSLNHQHLLEVEGFLARTTGSAVRLHFVPQSAPIVRGIFTTVFLPDRTPARIRPVFEAAYGGESLIDLVSGSPDLRTVQSTPRSVVGVDGVDDADRRGTVVFTAIDNLGKGAAGQAIQNMNCALGLAPTEGLDWPGGFV
jgi:N-acetyl-gamma-glutamyl-phosphate reductase